MLTRICAAAGDYTHRPEVGKEPRETGRVEERVPRLAAPGFVGMFGEQLWFTGAAGEYNPNDPANDEVEPYSSWNKDLLASMPTDSQYKKLLHDPSKIWCFSGQAGLGKAYNPWLACD